MSKHFRNTISLCPECYKRIPAVIEFDESVIMKKNCMEHGDFESIVERDVDFYLNCAKSAAPTIYAGYFIDVTEKCNLKCKYCYYPVNNRKKDPSINEIVQNAIIHKNLAPFVLTGGEPTLRTDIFEIIHQLKRIGPVELLTNGTGIKESNIKQIIELLKIQDRSSFSLSIHPEILDDNKRVIDLFRKEKTKIEGILWVIDDLSQIGDVIKFCEDNKDVICSCRIKAATKVWNEQKPEQKIFVSDMLKVITEEYGASVTWWRNNKVSFVTVELNGIYYMLVSWYDRFNVDIIDINCAPYYQSKTGETMNILTAMLINEGIGKGYLNGCGGMKWE